MAAESHRTRRRTATDCSDGKSPRGSGLGEGTSTGKCGQIGAAPTKSGLLSTFIGRCKRLILRHNPDAMRFTADLLQACICRPRFSRQKHAETEQISGSRSGVGQREPPSLAAWL
ncbi:MAG: hypothetical protein EKK33_10890 [Bradyrhizobiaceae bacterium]|nr:MAG: hypothetical protein EKK33_10890 [Bradyrhizobiaceae bacterium]